MLSTRGVSAGDGIQAVSRGSHEESGNLCHQLTCPKHSLRAQPQHPPGSGALRAPGLPSATPGTDLFRRIQDGTEGCQGAVLDNPLGEGPARSPAQLRSSGPRPREAHFVGTGPPLAYSPTAANASSSHRPPKGCAQLPVTSLKEVLSVTLHQDSRLACSSPSPDAIRDTRGDLHHKQRCPGIVVMIPSCVPYLSATSIKILRLHNDYVNTEKYYPRYFSHKLWRNARDTELVAGSERVHTAVSPTRHALRPRPLFNSQN